MNTKSLYRAAVVVFLFAFAATVVVSASPAFAVQTVYFGSGSTEGIWNSSGNVGIGTTTPAYTLDVMGTGNFTGAVNVGTPVAVSNAATKSYVDSAIANVTGTLNTNVNGTANYFPVFTGTNTIGNSVVYQSGGNVGIGTTGPSQALEVNGGILVDGSNKLAFNSDAVHYYILMVPRRRRRSLAAVRKPSLRATSQLARLDQTRVGGIIRFQHKLSILQRGSIISLLLRARQRTA